MTKKIFQAIMIAAGAVLLASLVIILGCLYDYFGNVQERQLEDELSLAAAAVEEDGLEYLEDISSDRYRLTWLAENGDILYDTQADGQSMENHADREEIIEAMQSGTGHSSRYSATLLEKTVYCARRLGDGTILRISVSRATVGVILLGMLQPFFIVLIVALILAGILASGISRRIVVPLNRLDLEKPLENDTYDELAPLLGRINQQHSQIDQQLKILQRKNDEFAQVTGNMKESLVLLNEKGVILSINPAAQKLFGTDRFCVGEDFLTIDRSTDMRLAIQSAMSDGHSEIRTERGGKMYQFDISRIESDGAFAGAVLLAFDITEQAFAENIRREFTANVSHELKTPLQSIMGSAELIENGLVKKEDMPRFIGHIRTEAARLVSLIDDIIRLSQLDEGCAMQRESVDLYETAAGAAEALKGAADAAKVKVTVSGESVVINGVPSLLSEIIYNLCDNAIKYNTEGGSVDITVSEKDNEAVVTVSDTGIGIPAEHQARVFERFYRVDKSHSKSSGGTGLGLSIVKHAVQYHNGRITLKSEPGNGTTITVAFPIEQK